MAQIAVSAMTTDFNIVRTTNLQHARHGRQDERGCLQCPKLAQPVHRIGRYHDASARVSDHKHRIKIRAVAVVRKSVSSIHTGTNNRANCYRSAARHLEFENVAVTSRFDNAGPKQTIT